MTVEAKKIELYGKECISLKAGGYHAVVAPFLGSNVIRFCDTLRKFDILRYEEDITLEDLIGGAATHGLPTLYLPNRLRGGVLKTTDAVYNLPLNEPEFNSHLHGFLHLRPYTVTDMGQGADYSYVKTEYVYDENDEYFKYLPLKFKVDLTIKVSENGLDYRFGMTNMSDKKLPFGMCSHTSFLAPFIDGGDGMDVRLYMPISERVELDDCFISTEEFLPLDDHDKQYLSGSLIPVHQVLETEFYVGKEGEKDGKPYYGITIRDEKTDTRICYEFDKAYKFMITWNEGGEKGYFCVEPQTWMTNAPNLSLFPETTGYQELAPGEYVTLSQKLYVG